MKNNTKIRLKLSKQLFESLAKQVLAEGKKGDMSGGAYTEAVKQPKGGEKKSDKSEKNEDLNLSKNQVPQVRKTGPSNSDAPKVGSKQQLATALRQTGVDLAKDTKANIQSGESSEVNSILKQVLDIADDKDNSGPALKRLQTVLTSINKGRNQVNLSKNDVPQVKKFEEMQTNIDEDDTVDFQKGAFDVSEMGHKKNMKEADHVVRGAEVAAKDMMSAISSGDPFAIGMLLVASVVGGVFAADKVAQKVKGYYQALTQDEKTVQKAEELADEASKANIDVK